MDSDGASTSTTRTIRVVQRVVNDGVVAPPNSRKVVIFHIPSGGTAGQFQAGGFPSAPVHIALTPDGSHGVVAHPGDHDIRIFEIPSGRETGKVRNVGALRTDVHISITPCERWESRSVMPGHR